MPMDVRRTQIGKLTQAFFFQNVLSQFYVTFLENFFDIFWELFLIFFLISLGNFFGAPLVCYVIPLDFF